VSKGILKIYTQILGLLT